MGMGVLATAWAPGAAAQAIDQPFAEGFELNPIEPAPAGDRFFLVSGGFSDPDAPDGAGPVRAMLLSHYSLAPSLTRTDNATGETREIVQNQLYLHANVTGYVLPWLMVNADLPFAAYQRGEGPLAPSTALGDLRLGARFGVVGKRSSGFALSPGLDLWLPTGSPDNLTGDTTTRTEPYVSVSGQGGVFIYAAKLGVQFRNAVYTGSLETGTSMTYGAAIGLSLFDNVFQIGPEIAGRTLMSSEADQAFSGAVSPLTGMLGARVQVGVFNIGAGFGLGLTEAPGTAPRGLLSLAYNPIKRKPKAEKPKLTDEQPVEEGFVADEPIAQTRVDSDGDNIFDDEDACPDQLGDASDDPSSHGCPYRPPAAPVEETPVAAPVAAPAADPNADADGDGISDSQDSCPNEPGVRQTNNIAQNGCPASAPTPTPQKPAVVQPTPKGPPTATWVGFRELGPSSALIYVNLTEAVPVSSEVKGNTLIYTMTGTRVHVRNNRNPLLAGYFGNVVKSARLVPRGKDVQLVIELSGKATPNTRVVRETQGATLRVELTGEPATPSPNE